MKIKLPLLMCMFITGCSTTIKVPVNSPPPVPDKATIVFIYNGMGIYETHKTNVFIDDKIAGVIDTMSPLMVTVSSGQHKLYSRP